MDDVDSSEAPASTAHSYGSRLRRATLTLGCAIAVHVWLVPALRIGPQIAPVAPELVQAGVLAQPQTLAGRTIPARFTALPLTSGVRVTTELIDAPEVPAERPSSDRTASTPAFKRTVNDAALRAYALGATTTPRTDLTGNPVVPASLVEMPLSRRELSEPRISEAPLALPETRDRPDVPSGIVPVSASFAASPVTAAAHDRLDARQRDEEEEIVRQVLRDYARAYERLDVQAAKAIYPTVDGQALQRAFEQLDAQQLAFASCGVVLTGRDANARCRGDATYRPKVGSRTLRLTAREWTFNLSRDNDRWQIVKATLH